MRRAQLDRARPVRGQRRGEQIGDPIPAVPDDARLPGESERLQRDGRGAEAGELDIADPHPVGEQRDGEGERLAQVDPILPGLDLQEQLGSLGLIDLPPLVRPGGCGQEQKQ